MIWPITKLCDKKNSLTKEDNSLSSNCNCFEEASVLAKLLDDGLLTLTGGFGAGDLTLLDGVFPTGFAGDCCVGGWGAGGFQDFFAMGFFSTAFRD